MIELKQVSKSFGESVIFENVNLKIDTCGIHVIEGSSGSGKSTLLHLIMGFDKVDQGEIVVDAQPVMIFQNYELLSELSVKENILLGRDTNQLDMELVQYFDMEEMLERRVSELSGGQKQRVGIIRALSFQPSIILCDEPTESLDIHNKLLVMELLKKWSQKAIILLVSHDHQLVRKYGDAFYLLENHQVFLKEQLNPDLKPLIQQLHFTFQKKEMKTIFHSLTYRRDYFYGVLRIVCFLLLSGMLLGVNQWLSVPKTTLASNADYLYIEMKEDNELIFNAYFDVPVNRACMKFQSAYYSERYYDIDIYPSINIDQGVYLNQNATHVLEDISIGDKLILYYIVDGIEYPYEAVVSGVVEDIDLTEPLIYYDAEEFNDYLKTIPYTSLRDATLRNQYDYLQKFKPIIEIKVPYSSQQAIYEKVKADIRLVLHAPLLEERLAFIEETSVYKVVYCILEIVLFAILVIFDLVYFNRNLKKIKNNLAVLTSQGMNLGYLKKQYFLNQCRIILISFVCVVGLFSVMVELCHAEFSSFIIPLEVFGGYTLLYVLVMWLCIRAISTREMAWILKNRWD